VRIKCQVYSAKDKGFKLAPITFHVLGQWLCGHLVFSASHCALTVVYFWCPKVSNTGKGVYSTVNCTYFTIFSILYACMYYDIGPPRFLFGEGEGYHKICLQCHLCWEVMKCFCIWDWRITFIKEILIFVAVYLISLSVLSMFTDFPLQNFGGEGECLPCLHPTARIHVVCSFVYAPYVVLPVFHPSLYVYAYIFYTFRISIESKIQCKVSGFHGICWSDVVLFWVYAQGSG
jgi:hypothetical protein